jgi:hypothetical protein
MHRLFADWYREASVTINPSQLEQRWAGIEEFASQKKNRLTRALQLIRIFYSMPGRSMELTEEYRDCYKKHDPSFPMRDNEFELQVLAGATLIHMIESWPDPTALHVALSLTCCSVQGLRPSPPIPDAIAIAKELIAARSLKLRSRGRLSSRSDPRPISSIDFGELQTNLEQGSLPTAAAPLVKLLQEFVSVAGEIVKSLRESALVAQLQQEEIDILWWVFSAWSKDLNEPFLGVGLPVLSLVVGKELGDLITVLPGPLGARAIISHILTDAVVARASKVPSAQNVAESHRAPLIMKKAIDAAPPEWRRRAYELIPEAFQDMLPVHLAFRLSGQETSQARTWAQRFSKMAALRPSLKIEPTELAFQCYQERLLIGVLVSMQA